MSIKVVYVIETALGEYFLTLVLAHEIELSTLIGTAPETSRIQLGGFGLLSYTLKFLIQERAVEGGRTLENVTRGLQALEDLPRYIVHRYSSLFCVRSPRKPKSHNAVL